MIDFGSLVAMRDMLISAGIEPSALFIRIADAIDKGELPSESDILEYCRVFFAHPERRVGPVMWGIAKQQARNAPTYRPHPTVRDAVVAAARGVKRPN